MSSNKMIWFYGDLEKIIPELSPNIPPYLVFSNIFYTKVYLVGLLIRLASQMRV